MEGGLFHLNNSAGLGLKTVQNIPCREKTE